MPGSGVFPQQSWIGPRSFHPSERAQEALERGCPAPVCSPSRVGSVHGHSIRLSGLRKRWNGGVRLRCVPPAELDRSAVFHPSERAQEALERGCPAPVCSPSRVGSVRGHSIRPSGFRKRWNGGARLRCVPPAELDRSTVIPSVRAGSGSAGTGVSGSGVFPQQSWIGPRSSIRLSGLRKRWNGGARLRCVPPAELDRSTVIPSVRAGSGSTGTGVSGSGVFPQQSWIGPRSSIRPSGLRKRRNGGARLRRLSQQS